MRVKQAFIHVDVDNLRAIFDLIACNFDGGFIVASEDELFELGAAGHIGALTNIDEAGGGRCHVFCSAFKGFRRPLRKVQALQAGSQHLPLE